MATLQVQGSYLRVNLSNLEAALAFSRGFSIPLRCISGVTIDHGIGAFRKGLRVPGTHVPGFLALGTFVHDGIRTFWSIKRGSQAIVVTLKGAKFDRVIVEVEDPYEVVTAINQARANL